MTSFMILLTLSAAWAAPLVLRVHDDEAQLQAPAQLTVVGEHHDALVALADGGLPPDAQPGDRIFTTLVDPLPQGDTLTLRLVDSTGRTWTGQVAAPQSERADLDVIVQGEALLPSASMEQRAKTPSAPPQALPAEETALGKRELLAWVLAALGWFFALVLLTRIRRRAM